MLALETATEATRRAASLLDAVDDFEIEALRAESTLAEVVADSRGDLAALPARHRTRRRWPRPPARCSRPSTRFRRPDPAPIRSAI